MSKMDVLSKLDESDGILSEDEDCFVESNWRKLKDHSAAAQEMLSHANTATASSLLGSREVIQNTILDPLIALERTARMSGDINTVISIVEEICKVYFIIRDFADLQKVIKFLMTARGQSPQVQASLLKNVMRGISSLDVIIPFGDDQNDNTAQTGAIMATDNFIPSSLYDEIGDASRCSEEDSIIHALLLLIRTLSQGKMHVELEYAQSSMILARVCERQGNVGRALRVIQKVGIERLSTISRLEKTKCLIYQLALALDNKNFVAFEKIVRKVSRSTLESSNNAWLYRTYLLHLVEYFSHLDKQFATFLCHWELFLCRDTDTPIEPLIIRRAIFYLVLAPPESVEQRKDSIECTIFAKKYEGQLIRSDWIMFFLDSFEENVTKAHFSSAERDCILRSESFSVPGILNILRFFAQKKWISVESFYSLLEDAQLFQEFTEPNFNEKMRLRFAERIILIISHYYINIKLARLSRLVSLSEDEVETILRCMVSQKLINIKIDRVDGIVDFPASSSPQDIDVVNDSVKEILDVVEETCHLIEKEQLNQRVLAEGNRS